MSKSLLVALAIAAGYVLPAQAFVAENRLIVEPAGESSFNVAYRGQSGAPAFWCAAGDYVVRELGLNQQTRIYRTSSSPRRSGQGMSFSLSPTGARKTGLAILGDSSSLSAAHARMFCRELKLSD